MFEVIGTVVFAIPSAVITVQYKLDYFRIFLLAVTTPISGDVLRDIILGVSPPVGLMNPIYLIVASIITFLLPALGRFCRFVNGENPIYTQSYYISDALGLAVFIIIGVGAMTPAGYEKEAFLCIFVAMFTGMGGSMIRDILIQRIPVILRRGAYALTSVAGGLLCYLARTQVPQSVTALLSVLLMVSIRMLSLYFNIHTLSIVSQEDQGEPNTSE